MAATTRIGIVGAGGIVRDRHMPGLGRIEGVEVSAVCNRSEESSRRFCAEWAPQAEVVASWQEMLGRGDLDVIWVGTWPSMHCEISCAALETGHHVFCQARMAMNLEEARKMLRVAEGNPELVAMLCPPPMGMAGDHLVSGLLRDGEIGELTRVRLWSLNPGFLDPQAPAHWRQRVELSGRNVLTLGIYVEVLQRWLGPVTAVQAAGKVVVPVRDGYEVQIPDELNVLLEFENGALGTMELSGVASSAPGDGIEIYGSRGSIHYDIASDGVRVGREPREIPAGLRREWTVEEDFIRAVRDPSGPRPRPDFQDGVAYMAVVEAVWDALHTGERVEVPRDS